MTTRRIDCECVWDWNMVPPNNRDKGRLKDKHQASLVNLNGWGNANLSVIRSKIQKELETKVCPVSTEAQVCRYGESLGSVTRVAFIFRFKGIPPHVATNGDFPSLGTLAWSTLYFFPCTMSVVPYFSYTFTTGSLYFAANVLVSEISMIHFSSLRWNMLWASW